MRGMWLLAPCIARATTFSVPADGTLSAVYAAASDGDVIELPAGVVEDPLLPPTLDKRLTVRGQGVGNTVLVLPDRQPGLGVAVDGTFEALTVDGLDRQQIFRVTGAAVLTLVDVVLDAGSAPSESGGCIAAVAGTSVVATNTTFRGCTAGTGGALSLQGAVGVCTGCAFEGNHAISSAGGGGAIWLDGAGTVTLTDATCVDNVAEASSGGVISLGGEAAITVLGGAFDTNLAATAGGAIVARNGNRVTIAPSPSGGTTFANGSASEGSALACTGLVPCTLEITGATFSDGTATRGGHVSVAAGAVTVTDSTFLRGHATAGSGGALLLTAPGSVLGVTDSLFSANDASDRGGAVFATDTTVDLLRVEMCDNVSVDSGGAAYLELGPTMTVRNSTWLRNVALDSGGAIRFAGDGTVSQSTFAQNSAGNDGAAIGSRGANARVEVYGSVFSEQATSMAVETTIEALPSTIAVDGSAAFGNAFGDYGTDVTSTGAVLLTTDPYPALPGGCELPIPLFGGELVDAGNLVDLDGSPSDLGATGGPHADPALWSSDGDPVPPMWDCDPLSADAWPGNVEVPGDGIDNDCTDGDEPLPGDSAPDTAETGTDGTGSGRDDTGTGADPDRPAPDVRAPELGPSSLSTGCGCGSARTGPGWLLALLAAARVRSRRKLRG